MKLDNKTINDIYDTYCIECDKGWSELIYPIIKYIKEYNKGKTEEEKIIVEQIKEKFGGLRIYVSPSTDELDKMIDKAEDESYLVCEKCGSRNNVGQICNGWITTICHDCVKKLSEENNRRITWKPNNGEKIVFNN